MTDATLDDRRRATGQTVHHWRQFSRLLQFVNDARRLAEVDDNAALLLLVDGLYEDLFSLERPPVYEGNHAHGPSSSALGIAPAVASGYLCKRRIRKPARKVTPRWLRDLREKRG